MLFIYNTLYNSKIKEKKIGERNPSHPALLAWGE
jgi:hypothetical protein